MIANAQGNVTKSPDIRLLNCVSLLSHAVVVQRVLLMARYAERQGGISE